MEGPTTELIPLHVFESLGRADQCVQATDLRLPSNVNSCIRVQPKAFDQHAYQIEDNVTFKDEKAIQQTKVCPLTSFIRWRYTDGTLNKDQADQLSNLGVRVDTSKVVSYLKQNIKMGCVDGV